VERNQGVAGASSFTTKLEILKYLTGIAEGEANRAWTRQTVLLSVNTALLGIVALILSAGTAVIVLLPAVLGLTTTYAWLRLNELGQFYQDRWYADIDVLIAGEGDLREWVRGRANPRVPRPVNRRGFFYFGLIPWVFLILWILLSVAAIGGLFFEPIALGLQTFASRQPGRP
jgi:hypothetical protein